MTDPRNPNKVYTVTKLDESGDKLCYAYQIVDNKGRDWKLLRNKPNPALMFAIPPDFVHGPKILDKRWFTDRDRKTGEQIPLKFVD